MASKIRPRVIYGPYDLMSPKEKKEYAKGGEIMTSNLYEDIKNIPSYKEMKKMDREKAKRILESALKYHSQKDLSNHWDTSASNVSSFKRRVLSSSKDKDDSRYKNIEKYKPSEESLDQEKRINKLQNEIKFLLEKIEELSEEPKEDSSQGLSIEMNKEYNLEEASMSLMSLSEMLSNASSVYSGAYSVSVSIKESKKGKE